jgi:hypothetical protein
MVSNMLHVLSGHLVPAPVYARWPLTRATAAERLTGNIRCNATAADTECLAPGWVPDTAQQCLGLRSVQREMTYPAFSYRPVYYDSRTIADAEVHASPITGSVGDA